MSYIALYREWRPIRFEDVVEQEHVVRTLRYSVSTDRVAHAYLFCGTRGTGKTTMAHILSRAVNCLDPHDGEPCNQCEICREILTGGSMDVLEIDAASNNSVDNVRQIRDEVIYMPTKARKKVYIIDEVHMLSTGAFNALLKTLEEPPEHVMFILATTEPHKLPATILSRCQRFDFRRISQSSIMKQLDKIASSDGITLNQDAAALIARLSDGAMRDAISLLDQCISLGNKIVEYDDVLSVVGIVNDSFMTQFTDSMLEREIPAILENVSRLVADGRDISHFASDLVLYYRNLLICKSTKGQCDNLIEVPTQVLQIMKKQADAITHDEIIRHVKELSALEYNLKWAANPRVLLEVTLIKLCGSGSQFDASLADRLTALEKKLEGAHFTGQADADETAAAYEAVRTAAGTETSRKSETLYKSGSAPEAESVPRTDYASESDSDSEMGSVSESVSDSEPKAPMTSSPASTQVSPAGSPEFKPWPKVMKHLKDLGRMTIYAYLLNVKAIELGEDAIGLIIKENPIRASVSRLEHLKTIEEAVRRVAGREMKVKCLDEDVVQKTFSAAKPSEGSELLKKARNIADKAGLPFEIIDDE